MKKTWKSIIRECFNRRHSHNNDIHQNVSEGNTELSKYNKEVGWLYDWLYIKGANVLFFPQTQFYNVSLSQISVQSRKWHFAALLPRVVQKIDFKWHLTIVLYHAIGDFEREKNLFQAFLGQHVHFFCNFGLFRHFYI